MPCLLDCLIACFNFFNNIAIFAEKRKFEDGKLKEFCIFLNAKIKHVYTLKFFIYVKISKCNKKKIDIGNFV